MAEANGTSARWQKAQLRRAAESENRRRNQPRAIAAREIQNGSRAHEEAGRGVRPARMAIARSLRNLLGRPGPRAHREKPDSHHGRFDRAAPRYLPVHATLVAT